MADRIPQERRKLPFVNQVRTFPIQRHSRIHLENAKFANLFTDFIDVRGTLGDLLGSGCLSTPLDALDKDCAGAFKHERKNLV